MRPDRSHWLLVPLFALPLVVGAALAAWADSDYRSQMEATRRDSSAWIERALAGERAGHFWMRARSARPQGTLTIRPSRRFHSLTVAEPGISNEWAVWIIGKTFPEGPSAADLADPSKRMELELGSSDAPQPRAGIFARLYSAPDPAALRRADLPASTKLYLLNRISSEFPGRGLVRRLLPIVAAWEGSQAVPSSGLHRIGGGYLFHSFPPDVDESQTPSSTRFVDVIPESTKILSAHRDMGVLWIIGFGLTPDPDAVWVRDTSSPVRGVWWMKARYGPRWQDVPRYRDWFEVYVGASLAYLAFPIALWFAMRRRRQLDAARVRFLTEIAHDLRTPLTSVRLHAELLARSDKNRDKYLGILERESVRAGDLLGNLLDLSRLERGARKFELEPVDVAEVASACADEFRRLYPERADDLELQGSVDRVRADRTALARSVRNLLDNAGKYTEPGTSIRLCWSDGTLRVEDRGDGVPEPSRAFDRYVRGPNTDAISGTGLGLSLVRELVEGMGGTIQYRGGRSGAVFEIMLPRVNDA